MHTLSQSVQEHLCFLVLGHLCFLILEEHCMLCCLSCSKFVVSFSIFFIKFRCNTYYIQVPNLKNTSFHFGKKYFLVETDNEQHTFMIRRRFYVARNYGRPKNDFTYNRYTGNNTGINRGLVKPQYSFLRWGPRTCHSKYVRSNKPPQQSL